MTHVVGAKGQVVIPKEIRDELSLQPGDEVDFEVSGGKVEVIPSRPRRACLGLLAGKDLVKQLEADRRVEPR